MRLKSALALFIVGLASPSWGGKPYQLMSIGTPLDPPGFVGYHYLATHMSNDRTIYFTSRADVATVDERVEAGCFWTPAGGYQYSDRRGYSTTDFSTRIHKAKGDWSVVWILDNNSERLMPWSLQKNGVSVMDIPFSTDTKKVNYPTSVNSMGNFTYSKNAPLQGSNYGFHGYFYQAGQIIPLLPVDGYFYSRALQVNDRNEVLVEMTGKPDDDDARDLYVWSNGVLKKQSETNSFGLKGRLDDVGGMYGYYANGLYTLQGQKLTTYPIALNNFEAIIGDANNVGSMVIWSDGEDGDGIPVFCTAFAKGGRYYQPSELFDSPGPELRDFTLLRTNDREDILVQAWNGNNYEFFIATPVPEPTTIAVIGAGLAYCLRRRVRSK